MSNSIIISKILSAHENWRKGHLYSIAFNVQRLLDANGYKRVPGPMVRVECFERGGKLLLGVKDA